MHWRLPACRLTCRVLLAAAYFTAAPPAGQEVAAQAPAQASDPAFAGASSVSPSRDADVAACAVEGLPDSDGDGLSDACELGLAHAFAPLLVVRATMCGRVDAEPGLPGGGWFYAVHPVDRMLRIAYLPAYFRDCGWHGARCLLPLVNCAPHDGDSEAIVVEVERSVRERAESGAELDVNWRVTGVFLSAHCFGRSSRGCRWYRGADLDAFAWAGAAPVVWVAEGRHANYPSWQACEAGHHGFDTCRRHDARHFFPVHASRNIGSRTAPAHGQGCVAGRDLDDGAAAPDAVECFFRADTPFRGWQPGARGVTPYDRYLREIAGL